MPRRARWPQGSHTRIRNPLNGASLHLSVIERGLSRTAEVPAEMREATDVLRAEIWRLGRLVSDFLEVGRPRPLVRAECDLNELARATRTLLSPEAEARRVSLVVQPFPFPVVVEVDVERTKQVLVNLVRNVARRGEGGRARFHRRTPPPRARRD